MQGLLGFAVVLLRMKGRKNLLNEICRTFWHIEKILTLCGNILHLTQVHPCPYCPCIYYKMFTTYCNRYTDIYVECSSMTPAGVWSVVSVTRDT